MRRLLKASTIFAAIAMLFYFATNRSYARQDADQQLAQKIVSIFQNNCLQCHGAESKSGLDLRTREAVLKGGFRGAAIIPGNSKNSLLYQYVSGAKSPRMPLGSELDEDDVELIETWIDKGAIWPAALKINPTFAANFKEKEITDEHRKYWAFVKPERPAIPAVKNSEWVKNPIDAFILAALEKNSLRPSPPADKATLLRRVTFDLTGLPPTPDELQNFLRDNSPNAYEKIVDRLLVSPRYGERWAQHWLDVVRFGETNGFELDAERPQAWRYRDYVVNSLNADKPYDQFLREQIAGDEIAPNNFEAQIATGFLRAGPQHVVAGNLDKAELRQEYLTETMFTIGSGVLGLTVGCARCHDHKFDPILQSDFYKLQAFFAATDNTEFSPVAETEKESYKNALKTHEEKLKPIKDQLRDLEKPYEEKIRAERRAKLEPRYLQAYDTPKENRTPEQKEDARFVERVFEIKFEDLLQVLPADVKAKRAALRRQIHDAVWDEPEPLPKAQTVADRLDPIPASFVFKGGEVHTPTREVQPQIPRVMLATNTNEAAQIPPHPKSTGRRTALANWLTSPENPLTARVMVNRLWQHHFGRGLVATPNDFGRNGSGVTNQALLDWLATEFTQSGWRLKKLHKLMVMSATYQQSSSQNPQSIDPENKLLWRMNRQRLDAEAIRDAVLATAGTLTEQLGGPSVRVPLEPEVVENIFTEYEPDNLWPVHPDTKQHTRRSLYLMRKRNVRLPLLVAYDAPDLMSVCGARNVSVHSLQALTMLNSDFMLAQSKALAGRVLSESKSERQQIFRLYLLAFGREPRNDELNAATTFLNEHKEILRTRLKHGEKIAEVKPLPSGVDALKAAAWIDLCLATLNLNEFVYVK